VTLVAERTASAAPPAVRRRSRGPLLAAVLVLLGLLASLVVAAPSLAAFGSSAPRAVGAPYVTVPEYGEQGGYILGYVHGADVDLTVPIHNTGRLPVTITAVSLGGGIAPLLAVRAVHGLPLTVAPGRSGTVLLAARLTNCRYYNERAMQVFDGVTVGYRSLWRSGTSAIAFDRPIYLKGPMLVGCPGRKLDRDAENRSDLL
jgi:hypothetical protein